MRLFMINSIGMKNTYQVNMNHFKCLQNVLYLKLIFYKTELLNSDSSINNRLNSMCWCYNGN